jgi:RNA polymerase sigma factor (sigma-70 family)
VTQAAFVDAYRAVLRGSKPESPRAWLLAIAENVRRRRFRRSLRRPREEPLDEAVAPEAAPLEAQELRDALAELPPAQREVFVLRELSGLSYDEIADVKGTTVASVQMSLFRARQTLRASLEPPTVARRGRVLMPFPAWLPQFLGRTDATLLSPRGFAAAGLAAIAIGGFAAKVEEPLAGTTQAPAALESAGATPAAVLASHSVARGAKPAASTSRPAPPAPPSRPRSASAAPPGGPRAAAPEAAPPAGGIPAPEAPVPPPAGGPEQPAAPPAAAPTQPVVPQPAVPAVTVPELQLPQLEVPQLELPQLVVPPLQTPEITVPQLPLPVELPPVTVPPVSVPAVTVPAITVPAVTLPPIVVPPLPLPTPP